MVSQWSDDEIFRKFMTSKENKHKFIKLLSELLVEEKSYVVYALEDEVVMKQQRLWHSNLHKECIPPNDMTLTPRNMTMGFLANISIYIYIKYPSICLPDLSLNSHFSISANPNVDIEP